MADFQIAFESMEGRYRFEGVTSLLNAYAEKGGNDTKRALSVHPCNGIVEFVDQDAGPCRGMIYLPDLDKAYSIHPSSCYRITFDGTTATSTRIGTVPGTDNVQLSRNQNASPQVVVQADLLTQVIASDSLNTISDSDFPDGVTTVDYIDGYTAAGIGSSREWYISGINDSLTWDALDFATFEQKAGSLVRIAESSGELVGFCSNSIEFWRDTGNADFPFEPIGFRSRGMKAPDALVRCDNTLFFPGDDGIIYRLANYDPQRISTHSIERLIHDDDAVDSMLGFSWSHDGHAFANLTGSDWSRCYDAATQVWHTRQSHGFDTWRGRHTMEAWNRTIIGDSLTGKLGYLSNTTFTEFGNPIIWGVDSPTLHVFPNGGIVDAFHMDLAVGYGTLSGQGSNPKIMFEVSRDGGYTFEGYRELELGVTGHYTTRVTARRLGRFGAAGMVFRLRISDPVVRALVGTDVEVRPLKNGWRPHNG